MPDKHILVIDQSTSGTKAIIFDENACLIHRETIAHKQYYPRAGWVEHDPEEIYSNTLIAIKSVIKNSNVNPADIAGLAITNQRETIVAWNGHTGKPVYHAVVWQCQRGREICDELKEKGMEPLFQSKTGLIIDPYFSASGIHWIFNSVKSAKEIAKDGNLFIGTVDTWLIWKLTGGQSHVTDLSNACRTMLFNIHDLTWDKEILNIFGIDNITLPEVKFSDEVFGKTNLDGYISHPIPITGVMGDSHAALFGQNCFKPGLAKATYGTGSSIMMNIGAGPLESPKGLVTSVGFGIKNKVHYVFEGNIHSTGATISWMIDELGLLENSGESEGLALSVPDTNGVYLVPAFTGLGAPYWNNQARALITGMDRGTTKAHIVRAALEAIAYQVKDLIDLMTTGSGIDLIELRVDGGPTKNKFLMQFQADMLGTSIIKNNIEEASALGVALAAGLNLGFWNDLHELEQLSKDKVLFDARMGKKHMERYYAGWKKAVERTLFDT